MILKPFYRTAQTAFIIVVSYYHYYGWPWIWGPFL